MQNTGLKKVEKWSKDLAKMLGYPDFNLFTSHAFRRTAATLLVDSGIDMINLKRMGRWKSDACVEGYLAASVHLKRKRAEGITSEIDDAAKNCKKQSRNISEQRELTSSSTSRTRPTKQIAETQVAQVAHADVNQVAVVDGTSVRTSDPAVAQNLMAAAHGSAAMPQNQDGGGQNVIYHFFFGKH